MNMSKKSTLRGAWVNHLLGMAKMGNTKYMTTNCCAVLLLLAYKSYTWLQTADCCRVKNRITRYRIVGISAEQHSNSRSVIRTFDKVIVHSYIHIKLTNILVCEFMCLKPGIGV